MIYDLLMAFLSPPENHHWRQMS